MYAVKAKPTLVTHSFKPFDPFDMEHNPNQPRSW